jgi:hypothetical protein
MLRPDTYRVPVDDGLYFLGHQGPVYLTGASIATWVERLAPYLDGRYTLADLTQSLTPERREMVERLVTTLRSRDVVRERGEDVPSPLPEAEAARYGPEITFLDQFRDAAAPTFARYRAGTAVVVGAGPLLPAVVRAARRSGLATIRVDSPGGSDEEELARLVSGASVVLQVGEDRVPASTRALERVCARAGVPMAQAVVHPGEAWLAPAGGDAATRWSAVRPRLRPASAPPGGNGPTGPASPASPAGAAARVAVASTLVHRAFRAFTGVDEARPPDRLIRIDLDTLVNEEHQFLAHPYALPAVPLAEDGFRERVAALAGGERLSEEEFSRRAARCVGERFGIVTLDEHDWVQSPLYVTGATVYPPGRAGVATTRVGFTYQAARVAATMRALAHYGELTVDPRRLTDPAGRPLAALDGNDLPQALAALRTGALTGEAWGYELPDLPPTSPARCAVRRVPAGLAFPRLASANRPAANRPEALAGLAAGFDWGEAVRDGLLGCCRQLTLDAVRRVAAGHAAPGHATNGYPAVDLDPVRLEPEGERSRALLAAIDEHPEVYDITGPLGVPTYAFCLGPDTVAATTGHSPASALSAGLVQALRAVQARVHGQPAVAPPAGPELPPHVRGRILTTVDETAAVWGVAALADRLRDIGRVAVAVPLDHDPRLAELMPYLVHVVLCDD